MITNLYNAKLAFKGGPKNGKNTYMRTGTFTYYRQNQLYSLAGFC